MARTTSSSSIGLAFAGKTASVDIPHPLLAPAPPSSSTLPTTLPSHHPAMLPTPPNSISPSLPPQGFKRQLFSSARPPALPPTIDSDIDLHSPPADFDPSSLPAHSPSDGADGAITPSLLAKHHLPSILLTNGPLAIRHVMSYLTVQVPGFSGIPPAKARRIVVSALECRRDTPSASSGGLVGDVVFEKVGWGRWDARVRGQPPRDTGLSPPASAPGSYEPRGSGTGLRRPSWADRDSVSAVFSHDDEAPYGSVIEEEADKMSLDSSSAGSPALGVDDEDTDAEDWATIGAAALRASKAKNARRGRKAYLAKPVPSRGFSPYPMRSEREGRREASRARGVQGAYRRLSEAEAGGAQEREAIEALVNLGRS
ncbi:MAG: DNA-binding proteins Bright/BRCAA1/RBP1 and proteins containing BRIGHT domain [Vezdaea aestivalis]|nr:MAG: DNA-binding proteins Bright/BRCAA1/RBP1 and proteins containing BRIGHT domain [Vezdaea aestivalis]